MGSSASAIEAIEFSPAEGIVREISHVPSLMSLTTDGAPYRLGQRSLPQAVEVGLLRHKGQFLGLLIESPEPIRWERAGIPKDAGVASTLLRSDRTLPPVAPPGITKLIGANFVAERHPIHSDPNDEYIELMLRDDEDLDGYVLQHLRYPGSHCRVLTTGVFQGKMGTFPSSLSDAEVAMKRRPTIIDVAKQAGVSKTTVSRVVSGDDARVRESTRRRVRAAVEALGYEHNAVASSLRTDRTNIIMLAIPDITNPFWPDVARGVQDVMDREGYAVVFANSDWTGQREATFLQMAGRNRFDGILINPIEVTNDELKATRIPTVVLSSGCEYPDFDAVGSDSYGAARQALEHLIGLGHRRIGLIRGRRSHRPQHSRLAGYLDYLAEQGLPIDDRLVVEVSFDEKGGFQAVEQLLALAEPPTAVFASNDLLAIGALHAAHAAGLHVPSDLSIVGLDDIHAASTTTPPLTTIAKPKATIGQQAAHFLLDHLRNRAPAEPRRQIVACHLLARGTTAPPAARKG